MSKLLRHVLLGAVVATAGLLVSPIAAQADNKTWCVGGFDFNPTGDSSRRKQGCYREGKRRGISSWHWHSSWFMTQDGQSCYTCWDMTDDTCNTQAKLEGWRVISPKECLDMGPASRKKVIFKDPSGQFQPPKNPADDMKVQKVGIADMLGTGPSKPNPRDTTRRPPAPPPPPPPPPPPDPVVLPPPPPLSDPSGSKPPPKRPTVRPKKPIKRPPAPKGPQQVFLNVRVSPGPYAIGDLVTVTGFAYTKGGRRPINGGMVVVYQNGQPVRGPDGRIGKHPTRRNPSGGATTSFKVPAGGSLVFRFVPDEVESRGNETLIMPAHPAEATINVAQCRLRGQVLSPADGELVAAPEKSKLSLRGVFKDDGGALSSDLRGATAFFEIDVDGVQTKVPAGANGAEYTAEVEVDPPYGTTGKLTVRFFGEGGNSDVCPGATANAQLTRLGVGLEVVTKSRCYVDRPCEVEARFKLPAGPSRAAAATFATAADVGLKLFENATLGGSLKPDQPGSAGSIWRGTFTPKTMGHIDLKVAATAAASGRYVEEVVKLEVREPIVLSLPPLLDLGIITAGAAWPTGCQVLDFSKSRGLIDQAFVLESTSPEGCDSTPAIESKGLGYKLPGGPEIEFQYDNQQVRICLADVPRCSSEEPAPIILTIKPKNPDFASETARVEIRWKVEGRGFLACHWWWIAAIAGGLFLLVVGFGFIKPYNFSAHDTIKMASDRKKLARAVGRRLRELPGGRSGWYRSAATGIRDDGSATSKARLAAVLIRAHKGDVYLLSRAGLERVHPGTKKLEPVDTGDSGVPASKGVVYHVGSLFFTIG